MNFKDALDKLLEGGKIKRTIWGDSEHYWTINQDDSKAQKAQLVNSIGDSPVINKAQLKADDWEVYEEKLKEKPKPMVIILDDNPISLAGFAEEYPESWKKICDAVEERK